MNSWTKGAIALVAAVAVGGAAMPAHAADITIKPVAGRYSEAAGKYVGGGNDVKAKRNNDGTYTLEKLVPTSTNAYAALIIGGVDGEELDELGTFSFSVDGYQGAGSPRMNLFYDNDGDGDWDGYAFGFPVGGTFSVDLASVTPFGGDAPESNATVVSLSILLDEEGESIISDVSLA
jgi:hypothetical protein